jgi:hypothetical protein
MTLLALWVVTAPFAAGALIGSVGALRRAVALHIQVSALLGWSALLFVFATVVLLHEGTAVATLVAAPFIGLAFWRRGSGSDEPPHGDGEPGPDGGDIDWNDFQRRLDQWSRRPLVHR